RKRKSGLRARLKRHFTRVMHKVITPAPPTPIQVTSFRGLPELAGGITSGVAKELGKVVKAAIGEEEEEEKKIPRIVGLRIS
ncbi:MAG: hypothetical protein QW343_03485, partial [Candidatus Norongarragalinales archaeon]